MKFRLEVRGEIAEVKTLGLGLNLCNLTSNLSLRV